MREGLLDALVHLKMAATQTGGVIKGAVVRASSDLKVGATVAAGTTASGVWTSKDLVTWVGVVLSACLIIKYIVDIKKGILEMEIMRSKEQERLSALAESSEDS